MPKQSKRNIFVFAIQGRKLNDDWNNSRLRKLLIWGLTILVYIKYLLIKFCNLIFSNTQIAKNFFILIVLSSKKSTAYVIFYISNSRFWEMIKNKCSRKACQKLFKHTYLKMQCDFLSNSRNLSEYSASWQPAGRFLRRVWWFQLVTAPWRIACFQFLFHFSLNISS